MYIVFYSNFARYIVSRRYKPCEFLGFAWTNCWGDKPYYVITSPANTTHWYLNIPLDQTHPFLKGFYSDNISNFRVDDARTFKTSQFKVKAFFNNLIPITLSEKEIITSSIEPPSPIQHLRRGAPFFNLPGGAKTPSSVCTPGVCHPGYATEMKKRFVNIGTILCFGSRLRYKDFPP